jgi:hypothetical protein
MTRMTILCLLTAYLAVSTTTATEPEPAPGLTTSIEPEPSPYLEGATTSTTSTPTVTTVAAVTTTGQQQTVTQAVTFVDLSAFANVAALLSSYQTSVSNATDTHASKVAVTIQSIVVKVSVTLSSTVDTQKIIEGIATHAGVPVTAVTIQVEGRRLFDDSLDERRLASMTAVADITVPANSTDIVQKAKSIHTAMQDNTALATVVSNVAGVTVTATTSVTAIQVTMQAVIATNGTLNIASINAAVGTSLGGNATGSVDTGITVVVTSSPSGGTASATTGGGSDYAECPGYVRVAFACVVLALTSRLGCL